MALKRSTYTWPSSEVTSRRGVGVRFGTVEALDVSLCGGANGADLEGSSNYPKEMTLRAEVEKGFVSTMIVHE